jgi:hypothetical protein
MNFWDTFDHFFEASSIFRGSCDSRRDCTECFRDSESEFQTEPCSSLRDDFGSLLIAYEEKIIFRSYWDSWKNCITCLKDLD